MGHKDLHGLKPRELVTRISLTIVCEELLYLLRLVCGVKACSLSEEDPIIIPPNLYSFSSLSIILFMYIVFVYIV